jgi:hypothetical protein
MFYLDRKKAGLDGPHGNLHRDRRRKSNEPGRLAFLPGGTLPIRQACRVRYAQAHEPENGIVRNHAVTGEWGYWKPPIVPAVTEARQDWSGQVNPGEITAKAFNMSCALVREYSTQADSVCGRNGAVCSMKQSGQSPWDTKPDTRGAGTI